MLFNSLSFIIFFPLVAVGYYLLPHRGRWAFLLAASYVFYMFWNPAYALLLLTSTAVTYCSALLISGNGSKKKQKLFLFLGIGINLAILFVFKYFELFTSGIYALLDAAGVSYSPINYTLLLPVGISFYTFQAIGYVIDVYRGDTSVQKHFGKYALFVSFFPQLVAGPIERSRNLLPQFDEVHSFDYNNAVGSLKLMLWGYYKKIVVADTVCVAVNNVYNNITSYDGFAIIIATFLFSIQIFCDFSGYSDIARGCARIMGFRLMKNFDHPYFSGSIRDFWRNWHISLSTWFKDYVYIPLGGNRKGFARQCLNLLITFAVSGLWHGANVTFIVWGALHGAFQIIGRVIGRLTQRVKKQTAKTGVPVMLLKMLFTFALVCFAWIFFRANTLSDALYAVKHLFSFNSLSLSYLFSELKLIFGTRAELYRLLAVLPPFILLSAADRIFNLNRVFSRTNRFVRFALYVLFAVYILIFARSQMQDFIYFQF